MKKIIKDILILCVITIICGGLLGYVYQITKNPIQHQLQQSKQDAYLKVMKEATSFKTYKENDIKKLSKKLKGDYGKNGLEIENALKAYHQKQTIGYIIQVVDHDGFGVSALDSQTRLSVSDDIGRILRQEKKTAILVTHDISEAISMADRVIILSPRPAIIRKIVPICFDLENRTPMASRNAPEFKSYFNLIWKELNHDV